MERMPSTWVKVVDHDMSDCGVRPLTVRELGEGLRRVGVARDAIFFRDC